MARQILETEQKALEINLDNSIYGSFAEIGAGQEVARYFFKVGAAAGTIAKTISAYDKVVSDAVYGPEVNGRYVCESRLYKMLDHEYNLMVDRLSDERPNTCLFVFADTVTTLNYHKTNKAHGWLGMRFQLEPYGEPNDLIVHIELLDSDTLQQQQAIGMLGVNIVHACYRYHHDYKMLIEALSDKIKDRIRIDLIRLSGPQFQDIDSRLLTLELVRQGLTRVALLDKKGKPVHPSEFLYKSNLMIVRGSFRPMNLVHQDILKTTLKQFKAEKDIEPRKTHAAAEITLKNLAADTGEPIEQDFLDRVNLLGHMGQMVMLTNCERYTQIVSYLKEYRLAQIGLALGARHVLELLNNLYHKSQSGELLKAFGQLFQNKVRIFIYPIQKEGSGELMTAENLPIPAGMQFLYQHILRHKHLIDVEGFDEKILHIESQEVLRKIRADEDGWTEMVSPKVAEYIQTKGSFNFPFKSIDFEY